MLIYICGIIVIVSRNINAGNSEKRSMHLENGALPHPSPRSHSRADSARPGFEDEADGEQVRMRRKGSVGDNKINCG